MRYSRTAVRYTGAPAPKQLLLQVAGDAAHWGLGLDNRFGYTAGRLGHPVTFSPHRRTVVKPFDPNPVCFMNIARSILHPLLCFHINDAVTQTDPKEIWIDVTSI